MSDNNSPQHFQLSVADPTPLGLLGLAVVTMVASAAKLEIVSNVAWGLPWALFCGASAQLVAGLLDYLHKNIFGGTVFCAFGFFWFGVGMNWMIKAGAFGEGLASGVDPAAIGFAFFAYFLFSLIATIAASSANLFLFVDMVLIDVLLICLSLDAWGVGGHAPHLIAAYAEMAISPRIDVRCGSGSAQRFLRQGVLTRWKAGQSMEIMIVQ
ncbi:acetate uptake transporter [Selenomonas noxia]|jgi:GPR1/FUN34/yaaH family protein|uniref:acetate uptake transporter n=1 Tax=Selenomonas noxia TaxID=135083 RepID=UPI0028D34AC7|nr:acetate uptake transporter [Selenomonas noxia]